MSDPDDNLIDAPDDFDPDDVDVDIVDVTTRSDAAMQASVRAYQQRLEQHLVAAWMAGFEAVDVLEPVGNLPHQGGDYGDPAVPVFRAKVHPLDDADADPVTDPHYQTTRYYLDDLTPDAAADARERWGDHGGP